MLKIEQFVEQHFGIKLTKHQLEMIAIIAASPEREFILQNTGRYSGKTVAFKAAMAYLQDGMKTANSTIEQRALRWALSDDTGISSETMCAFFTNTPKRGPFGMQAPSDAADRGRCIRLLNIIPEWIDRLDELKELDTGTISINGAPPIPRSQDTHSWTYQIPLILAEGGFNE